MLLSAYMAIYRRVVYNSTVEGRMAKSLYEQKHKKAVSEANNGAASLCGESFFIGAYLIL